MPKSTSPIQPIPDPAHVLSPYLIVRGASAALDFYARAFDAKLLFSLAEPDGKVGHAELRIGESLFMLADEYPDWGALGPASVGGTPVTLHLYVKDVDAAVARAEAAGATVLRAPKDEFFGDRSGMVVDPFGHKWKLASRIEDVRPEEMQKRWTKMLTQA